MHQPFKGIIVCRIHLPDHLARSNQVEDIIVAGIAVKIGVIQLQPFGSDDIIVLEITGELKLAMQLIAVCELERQAYGESVIDRLRQFEDLLHYFSGVNEAVNACKMGQLSEREIGFLRDFRGHTHLAFTDFQSLHFHPDIQQKFRDKAEDPLVVIVVLCSIDLLLHFRKDGEKPCWPCR